MLDVLRSTAVEPGFRPADDQPKTLHDFVDGQGVDNLKSSIRSSIDQIQEAQKDFGDSISSFDSDLQAVEKAITSIAVTSPSSSDVLPSLRYFVALNPTQKKWQYSFNLLSVTSTSASQQSSTPKAEERLLAVSPATYLKGWVSWIMAVVVIVMALRLSQSLPKSAKTCLMCYPRTPPRSKMS
jgi:hypothetical protein